MELKWTNKGLSDLARLNDFLAPVNPAAELRYEIQDQVIYILRIWHTREDR
jgi:plasmid stabilization system protein ParE